MRVREQDLTFNTIFLPGTVQPLLPFAFSLLEHSSCRFRLVANGCSRQELDLLEALCRKSARFQLHVSGDQILPHHEVLTRLQRLEESPCFAFMDSDIFATGPFLPHLLTAAREADAVFSCTPFWRPPRCIAAPGQMVLFGQYCELDDGTCVGNSYFAIYDNEKLSACVADTGIDFRIRSWRQIPPPIREELKRTGMVKAVYDTGKLLNILLTNRGGRLMFCPSPSLVHIGGVSIVELNALSASGLVEKLKTSLRHLVPSCVLAAIHSFRAGQRISVEENVRLRREIALRNRVASYCREVMALADSGHSPKQAQFEDAHIEERCRTVQRQLRHLLKTYGKRRETVS